MSIRAYYIEEIKTNQRECFNLWHDEILLNTLNKIDSNWRGTLNDDLVGIVELPISLFESTLKELQKLQATDEVISSIADVKWIIAHAKERGDTYIRFMMY